MKIWKAELILCANINESYDLIFEIEEQKEDYKINEKYNEWIYFANWVSRRIPMNMTIESSSYSVIKAIQGFDYEPNKEELKQLESDMKKLLIDKLNTDKEKYLQEYQTKINLIQGK